jgi:hypothetical protein
MGATIAAEGVVGVMTEEEDATATMEGVAGGATATVMIAAGSLVVARS